MKTYKIISGLTLGVVIFASLAPSPAEAELMNAAWIPYWREEGGVAETRANLDKLSEISPFSYTVNENAILKDEMGVKTSPWVELFIDARKKGVKILPSVHWADSLAIDQTLSVPERRQAHVENIVALVRENRFDGIDIDYENKFASTSPYFSAFLKELSAELHRQSKILSCSIEARTPPSSRYLTIPDNLEYANDYKEINLHCDRVRLMTYDQGTDDIKLNMARRRGGFYYPIADPAWVRKVVELAVKDIDPKKILLGVATYGYEMKVVDKRAYFDYERVRSLSYRDLLDLSAAVKIPLQRNNAGELYLTYIATSTGEMRFASFSDGEAIARKVRVAEMYGLRGVAIFKVDGEDDASYWQHL